VSAAVGLELRGISVRFGGVTAVDGLSLRAPPGVITGLIGPNGAGKTTTFNACCGLVPCAAGSVHLGGVDVTQRSPASRARLGLGRTFQRMQLYSSMTVRENLTVACEARLAGANPLRQIVRGRGDRRVIDASVEAALGLCSLEHVVDALAGSLSTGQRRLVDLARACVADAEVLLLDEPSSGLDRQETAQFAEILRGIMAARPVAILLVEHDMGLVMSVCEYLYVLDFGRRIFEGTPVETRASSAVRAAYLGSDDGLLEPSAGPA
jgi:ABC-type branched-subunit amino acid transport system ATPase component